MNINRIKFSKDNSPSIEYQIPKGSGRSDTIALNSNDLPAPKFQRTLQSLAPFVAEMCELSKGDVERLRITAVSYQLHTDDNIMGVTITATKSLRTSDTPLILNTPHKLEPTEGKKTEPKKLLPKACVAILKELQKHAEEFVKGKRAQRSLFNGDAGEGEKE